MVATLLGKISQHFENVTDPRMNRGANYPLLEMAFAAVCGAICDCNSWVDIATFGEAKLAWFRKFLPFEKGIPSHDTFTEVFAGSIRWSSMPVWSRGRTTSRVR